MTKDYSIDHGVDGKVLLKWIIYKCVGRFWTEIDYVM
jgi:hypothetical protein